ncbi:uncharacterized protein [Rutidosis leptorrhynchoides]
MNILYFWIGFLLSSYGCYKHFHEDSDFIGPRERTKVADFWTRYLQIIFQMQAGAMVLALSIFWAAKILPLVRNTSNMDSICIHSVNLLLMLVETALNNLRFPWFRIAYFMLLTWTFTIFYWIFLSGTTLGSPYTFLSMSSPFSPLW